MNVDCFLGSTTVQCRAGGKSGGACMSLEGDYFCTMSAKKISLHLHEIKVGTTAFKNDFTQL